VGTSNSYGGPSAGTPLVPSWLPPNESEELPGPEEVTDENRFQTARTQLSRFAKSPNTERGSLGRAMSDYVSKASGGSKRATQRMGTSRITATGLARFLSQVAQGDTLRALRTYQLESLAGKPITEVFLGIMERFCPDGGTVDEGIAREAFIATIADLAESGTSNLDGLNPEQIQTIFELYIAHSIEARLCNDIGTKSITIPATPREASSVQRQLYEFVRRGVTDACAREQTNFATLDPAGIVGFVERIYFQAFTILRALGDVEAGK